MYPRHSLRGHRLKEFRAIELRDSGDRLEHTSRSPRLTAKALCPLDQQRSMPNSLPYLTYALPVLILQLSARITCYISIVHYETIPSGL